MGSPSSLFLGLQIGVVPPQLVSLAVGVITVLILLVWWDLPPFVGLIIAAFAVGLVTPEVPLSNVASETATEFGNVMTSIGIPILMAAIIGKSMTDSGAAQRIVRGFASLFGEERSEYSLFSSSFVISIPVFFDNVFFLLAPLARSMTARTGKNYTLYIVVVTAAGIIAHSFVPPTPGPLAAAETIGVDLGITIIVGLVIGLLTAVVGGLPYAYWINQQIDIPLRDSMGTTTEELHELIQYSNDELPGLFESLLPILIAVGLVMANTVTSTFFGEDVVVTAIASFVGNPNFALTAAAIMAAVTYYRIATLKRSAWSDELTESLRSGGNMAAITSAGGAFGALLATANVGSYVAGYLETVGLGLLVTAWIIAAAIRAVQGSATVAILTTAGIVAPLTGQLAVHPAYLIMAIGAGASCFSWYNDSGFWVVSEIGGLTQAETLKTWSAGTTVAGVVGLIVTLLISTVFPLV